jgi:hypothetical protein
VLDPLSKQQVTQLREICDALLPTLDPDRTLAPLYESTT